MILIITPLSGEVINQRDGIQGLELTSENVHKDQDPHASRYLSHCTSIPPLLIREKTRDNKTFIIMTFKDQIIPIGEKNHGTQNCRLV